MQDALTLLSDRSAARVGESVVPLGRAEFAVLATMVERPHVVWHRERLAAAAHASGSAADATLVKHVIYRLRRKLGPAGATLQSVRSVGYRYNPDA